jgi:hypothetical protein
LLCAFTPRQPDPFPEQNRTTCGGAGVADGVVRAAVSLPPPPHAVAPSASVAAAAMTARPDRTARGGGAIMT